MLQIETARALEPDRPIELETSPAPVLGDRDRLRQVVDNLKEELEEADLPGYKPGGFHRLGLGGPFARGGGPGGFGFGQHARRA